MKEIDNVTINVDMTPSQFKKFNALGGNCGIADHSHIFKVALDLMEKAVNARLQGYLIGSVPQDAEAGKDGIIEILLSQESLAYESAQAPGVVFQ